MAVNFPTNLTTPSGSTFPLINLDENKIAGIGQFATLERAQALNADLRMLGYLALISDGNSEGSLYQYTGTNLDGWASTDNWTQVSGTASSSTGGVAYSHTRETTLHVAQHGLTTEGGYPAPVKFDHTFSGTAADYMPSKLEIRFDGETTLGYNLQNDDTMYYLPNPFATDMQAAVMGLNASDPITHFGVQCSLTVGAPGFYNADLNQAAARQSSVAQADDASVLAANWASASGPYFMIANYMGLITGGVNTSLTPVYMPFVPLMLSTGTIVYLAFDHTVIPASGNIDLATFANSDNWTVIWSGAGESPITLKAAIKTAAGYTTVGSSGIGLDNFIPHNLGATSDLDVSLRIDSVAEIENLRYVFEMTAAARDALLGPIISPRHPATTDDLKIKLSTTVTLMQ